VNGRWLSLAMFVVLSALGGTASAAQAAYLALGTTNTSNVSTTLSGSTAGPELWLKNSNASQPALRAEAPGSGAAVYAVLGLLTATSPTVNSAAIKGQNNATNTYGYGVFGSQGGSGIGVYGYAPSGTGVRGASSSGNGVFGSTNSANRFGVSGQNTAAGGVGVYGLGDGAGVQADTNSTGTYASGLYARVTSSSSAATSAAVKGVNNGNGMGVYGYNRNNVSSGYGVAGTARYGVIGTGLFAGASSGVYGTAPNGFAGVEGHSASATGYGVYGQNSGGGTGVSGMGGFVGVSGHSDSANGFGVWGDNGGGGTGVSGSSDSGTGVTAASNTGWALNAEGNATQNRTGNGFVKAMAYVDPSASNPIVRCFNSQLPPSQASSGNCGFTFTEPYLGESSIDFGFRVNDRFVMVTPGWGGAHGQIVANWNPAGTNAFDVFTFYSDSTNGWTNAPYFIMVF
jgi:hypothetical protein